ncbi:ammonium transporter [Saccharicrinis sp. FJH54]|uniref:ammonium transporter n=1 Tax=Saccharicrinis sp. FJH54 TaxID=3344665 RepID=UPI0035D45E0A
MDTYAIDLMWVLITGILVMFMQAGFALVETGFTRAKNAGNILMKNFMDFVFGSLLFWLVGYSIMYGGEGWFAGKLSFFYDNPEDMHSLFFQTVFAATAATIVSGAVAERTKFTAYLVISALITVVIYPISGHWIWGGGWLSELGFIDFAGSTAVHSVGGWAGLVGAILVGPRLGKYENKKVNAIPGHNLILGGLGVFILWLGWFGFNPGSQLAISGDNANAVAMIVITTNLAAAAGALAAMVTTWIQFGKPDISMTLNGALAGLVGITAGCAAVSPEGAVAIGIITGVGVVFFVELFDKVLKVDDPVGAISVHGASGALGTLLVGVFATDGGLLYGGGFHQLGIQAIGVLAVGAWTIVTAFILFFILKKTIGIRVPTNEEREGLDIHEHGQSVYN